MGRPRITILEGIHQEGIRRLEQFAEVDLRLGLDRPRLLESVSDSDAIIVKSVVVVDGELFEAAPRLRVVGRAGTGVDNLDLEQAGRRGIQVLTTPMGNTVSAAEFSIAQILMSVRRLHEAAGFVARNDFRRHLLEGRELMQLTVGLLGLGNVGMAVAQRLQPFGCRLLGWDPAPPDPERFLSLGGEFSEGLYDLLGNIDVLSVHARLTAENRRMIDADALARVRPGMLLVNSARADLVDDEALIAALNQGQLGWAALDVLEPEPPFDLPPEHHSYSHQLLEHPRVTVTPHMGASTIDAQRAISLQLAKRIEKVLSSEVMD